MENKTLVIFSDGGSRGNPGIAGCGFVLYEFNGVLSAIPDDIDILKKSIKLIDQGSVYIGKTTNNQAEWQGVVYSLELALDKYSGYREVAVYLDSELVVKQVKGIYKVKKPELKPWDEKVKGMLKKFDNWDFVHVRREYNKEADVLANEAMDKQV